MLTNEEYSLNEAKRLQARMQLASDPLTFGSNIVAGQGLRAPTDGFWRGLSGEGRGSVFEGSASFGENLGLTLNGMVTGPVRAAYAFATEIGSQYKDVYSLWTRDGYTPSSALAGSVQREGIGGTLGNMAYAVGSAPTQTVFDLLSGNYRAAGEGLLGTATVGMGAARGLGLRSPSQVSTAPISEGAQLAAEVRYAVGLHADQRALVAGKGTGLHSHHAGQSALMKDLVLGYDRNRAPTILVPAEGHIYATSERGRLSTSSVSPRTGEPFASARDLLARDIGELRRVYPDIPNTRLQQLIQLNKQLYPEMRK